MEATDVLLWVIVSVLAAGIVHANATAPAPLPKPPSSEREVDVTRWRHDGRQPTIDRTGNARPASDFSNMSGEQIEDIALMTH